jgi:hypothetical protein
MVANSRKVRGVEFCAWEVAESDYVATPDLRRVSAQRTAEKLVYFSTVVTQVR